MSEQAPIEPPEQPSSITLYRLRNDLSSGNMIGDYGRMIESPSGDRLYSLTNLPNVPFRISGDEPSVLFILPSGNTCRVTYEPKITPKAPKGLVRVSISNSEGSPLDEKTHANDENKRPPYLCVEGLYLQSSFKGGLSGDGITGDIQVRMQVPNADDTRSTSSLPQLSPETKVMSSPDRSVSLVPSSEKGNSKNSTLREVTQGEYENASRLSWKRKFGKKKQAPPVPDIFISPQYTSKNMIGSDPAAPIWLRGDNPLIYRGTAFIAKNTEQLHLERLNVTDEPQLTSLEPIPPNTVDSD